MHGKAWRRFLGRKTGVVGALLIVSIIVVAIASPLISPYDPQDISAKIRLKPPSSAHPFGTDHFGRDVLSRVCYGARVSLELGAAVGLLTGVIGLLLGAISGYFRSLGMVVMRVSDALMAFPSIIIALFLMAIIGRSSVLNVIIALTVTYLPLIVRTAYSLCLRIRECTYVEAAGAIGALRPRILFAHIIPNMAAPLIIQITFTCAMAILAASSLDFLGVGAPPYIPSWGGMINEGKGYLSIAPWMTLFPGVFIAALVLGLNLVGDALRDAWDPRFQAQL